MKKKFGILALVLVLALGSLGVGYAAWTDTIYVNGTVSTGEVCMQFGPSVSIDDTSCFDAGAVPYLSPPHDWNSTPGANFPAYAHQVDKNVACGSFQLNGDRDVLTYTFSNVYPYYYNHSSFWLCNCGTIPVKVQSFVFKDATGNIIGTVEKGSQDEDLFVEMDLDGNGVPDFQIQWGDEAGDQLEGTGCRDISFAILFLQDELMDFSTPQSYTFTIEVTAIQWNEY